METPSTTIGPGLGAFIAFLVLAIALWLLMRNMNSRMRRMAYREQQRIAELEAKGAKRRDADGAPTSVATDSATDSATESTTGSVDEPPQDAGKADPAP
jgi:hypothetical protein